MAEKRTRKVKRVLSGARTEYRKWADWDEEDVIVCKFVGKTPNKKNRDRTDWIVEVSNAFFSDKSEQKRVLGKRLTLNSAGQLDGGMEQLEIGQECQITYNGTSIMQGGEYKGQKAHLMEVCELGDDEDTSETDEDEDDQDDYGDDL